jgi:hypothetical protein
MSPASNLKEQKNFALAAFGQPPAPGIEDLVGDQGAD